MAPILNFSANERGFLTDKNGLVLDQHGKRIPVRTDRTTGKLYKLAAAWLSGTPKEREAQQAQLIADGAIHVSDDNGNLGWWLEVQPPAAKPASTGAPQV